MGEDAEFAGVSMGGMDDIFAAIGAVQKNEVQCVLKMTSEGNYRWLMIRASKRDPYIVAQKMIILGRTDALLNQFVDLLEQIQETVSEE